MAPKIKGLWALDILLRKEQWFVASSKIPKCLRVPSAAIIFLHAKYAAPLPTAKMIGKNVAAYSMLCLETNQIKDQLSNKSRNNPASYF